MQFPGRTAVLATHAGRPTNSGPLWTPQVIVVNATVDEHAHPIVYWHRHLPPLEAEVVAEHTVEATSNRIAGRIARRDELWHRCYGELMAAAEDRLTQEVVRLGGDFAHVYDEAVEPHQDEASGQGWLHGRFAYMLYRRPRGHG